MEKSFGIEKGPKGVAEISHEVTNSRLYLARLFPSDRPPEASEIIYLLDENSNLIGVRRDKKTDEEVNYTITLMDHDEETGATSEMSISTDEVMGAIRTYESERRISAGNVSIAEKEALSTAGAFIAATARVKGAPIAITD